MCTVCVRNLYLSEFGRDRREAGASHKHVNAAGRAFRSWLRLDLDGVCRHIHVYFHPAGPLSQLDVLPGDYLRARTQNGGTLANNPSVIYFCSVSVQ